MLFIAESCLWRMRLHGSAQLAFSSAARRTAQLTWLLMLTAHDCRAADRHRAADCTAGRLHSTANCSWFSGREAGCRMPRGRLRGSSRTWLWVELSAPLAARCVGRSRGAGCGAGSTRVTAESFLRKQTETRILRGRELAEKTPQKRKRVVAESFPRKQTETRLLCGGELSKKTLQK